MLKDLRKPVSSNGHLPLKSKTKTNYTNAQTIFSDAILEILRSSPKDISGRLELDEDFLRTRGVTDFSRYSVVPGATPRRMLPIQLPDLTVAEQADEGHRVDSTKPRVSKL